MQEKNVDVAVIGAGSAGLSAFRAAREHTQSVVLIEGGPYGTTCARVGCMPSKLLIAAAEAAHGARDSEAFGIHTDRVRIDGPEVMARVRRERDHFVQGVLDSVEKIDEAMKLKGYARFEDAHTLMVGDHTRVRAERIVLATGSSPTWPDFFEGAGDRLVTNEEIFDWEELPESVAVFGPGIIGLELGQALSRLGVRIRMFGVGGSVGAITDPVIRDYAVKHFNNAFYLDPDAETTSIERDGERVAVTFIERPSGQKVTEHFDYLLAATGRTPNIAGLSPERAGLRLENGVPEFNRHTLQCLLKDERPGHIFIAGDADEDAPLLHEATDEGRIAGDNAGRYPHIRAGKRRSMLSIVFSEPQIAAAGQFWSTLESRDAPCAVGEVSFESQGRARVIRQNHGLLRVYGEHGSGLFLGAEMLCPRAENIAHLLAWCHQMRLTVEQMLEMPFYHPVLEEGLRTALRDLNARLKLGPEMSEQGLECGPGT